jgi:hypothetical protein
VRPPIALAILAATLSSRTADACSGAEATLIDQFPRDRTAMAIGDAFAVHLTGELYDANPSVLISREGVPVDVALEVKTYVVGLYSSVFFFQPSQPLSRGDHQFYVHYTTRGSLAVDGPVSRFEVRSIERDPVPVRATWDLADFDERTGTSCGEYIQALRLRMSAERRSDDPLWLLVEITGHARPGTRPFATERTILVPTESSGGTDAPELTAELAFEADCVTVTPWSLGGPTGDPFETCQPDRCLSIVVAETDPFEPIDFGSGEPCTPRLGVGPPLATEDAACGCGTTSRSGTLTAALGLVLLLGCHAPTMWRRFPSTSASRRKHRSSQERPGR